MDYIDLHMHTKFGHKSYCTTEELLKMARDNGIKVVSFTDHNTLKAYYELRKMYSSEEIERIYGVRVVVGCEVNTKIGDECNDLLVYNIRDIDKFQAWLEKNTDQDKTITAQREQLQHYKTVAKKLGLMFDEDIDITEAEPWAGRTISKALAKYIEHNSKIIPIEELKDGTIFFIKQCCNPESPFYFDIGRYRPKVEDLMSIVEECGGIVFVAHPAAYHGKNIEDLIQYLEETRKLGIKGIEIGNCFNSDNEMYWQVPKEYCKRRNMLESAGTDIHTIDDIGYTRGDPNIKARYTGVGIIQLPDGRTRTLNADIEKWARYAVFPKDVEKEEIKEEECQGK